MDNGYKLDRLWHSDPDVYYSGCSFLRSPDALLLDHSLGLDHLYFTILSRNELGHLKCVMDGEVTPAEGEAVRELAWAPKRICQQAPLCRDLRRLEITFNSELIAKSDGQRIFVWFEDVIDIVEIRRFSVE